MKDKATFPNKTNNKKIDLFLAFRQKAKMCVENVKIRKIPRKYGHAFSGYKHTQFMSTVVGGDQ